MTISLLLDSPTWLVYLLGSLVVCLCLVICGIILYFISLRSGSVKKAKTKLPETEIDKISKFGTDPETMNKNKIQVIEDRAKKGFIVKKRGQKESIAFAKTKEEANEIAASISKQEASSADASTIEAVNHRGVDGEMVSYTNDRNV